MRIPGCEYINLCNRRIKWLSAVYGLRWLYCLLVVIIFCLSSGFSLNVLFFVWSRGSWSSQRLPDLCCLKVSLLLRKMFSLGSNTVSIRYRSLIKVIWFRDCKPLKIYFSSKVGHSPNYFMDYVVMVWALALRNLNGNLRSGVLVFRGGGRVNQNILCLCNKYFWVWLQNIRPLNM